MKTGIVICSRLASSRVPRKAMYPLNGIPLIAHLIQRLLPSGLPIIVAVPIDDFTEYYEELGLFGGAVTILGGFNSDPLARMAHVAEEMKLDAVVRITHDKIFVNPDDIRKFLGILEHSNLDYLYSSSFVPGTGFEVIRNSVLQEAAKRFVNIEHVSYAIHAVTDRKTDVEMGHRNSPHRLLIDYPDDVTVVETLLHELGNECTIERILSFLDSNPTIAGINQLPLVTIYTCAYNAEQWIKKAIRSVLDQRWFMEEYEYILVDDASTDGTSKILQQFAAIYDLNIRYIRNEKNMGLASSANVALSAARGKYIVRLDADDYFTRYDSVEEMSDVMECGLFDVIYPDHYYGNIHTVEKGRLHHHAGGAMFDTRALNYLRFTDGLRAWDSYDLFERAKTQLRIGYLDKTTFFYRQHDKSLSKTNLEEREKIKREIDDRTKI